MTGPDSSLARNAALSAAAQLTSSATLVCCVWPAALVTLGANAALAGRVTAVPQLIWLSDHKPLVFAVAGLLLSVSALALWHGRSLPCPKDSGAARTCQKLRRVSVVLFSLALLPFAIGALFAFILPLFSR